MYPVYTVYQYARKDTPTTPFYTGMTGLTLEKRHSARMAAVNSNTRNEPVNVRIRELGIENVAVSPVYQTENIEAAKALEHALILKETHVSVPGGTNRRLK